MCGWDVVIRSGSCCVDVLVEVDSTLNLLVEVDVTRVIFHDAG